LFDGFDEVGRIYPFSFEAAELHHALPDAGQRCAPRSLRPDSLNPFTHSMTMIHKLLPTLLAGFALLSGSTGTRATPAPDAEGHIALHYSDGTAPSVGLEAVNARLRSVGVRVSEVRIPDAARPLLQASRSRALSDKENAALIGHFQLGRKELVQEILRAGRQPEMPRGGYLQTSETGVSPYPKVYDMKALDAPTTAFIQRKFGLLHVNSSEAGVGIDEVMTIVSGGPYTWFFVLPQDVVGKLRFGKVGERGLAWRISYPGLVPHGGFFDAPRRAGGGLCPRPFVLRDAL
jgi:hypothetical protein